MAKSAKNRQKKFKFCVGYGVFKMTARPRGIFLDIMTTLQNAYFFIFLGVYGQKDQNVKKYLDLNNKEF